MNWGPKIEMGIFFAVIILAAIGAKYIVGEIEYLHRTSDIKFVRKYREVNRINEGNYEAFLKATRNMCPKSYAEFLEEETYSFCERTLSEIVDSIYRSKHYYAIVGFDIFGNTDTLYVDKKFQEENKQIERDSIDTNIRDSIDAINRINDEAYEYEGIGSL